MFLLHKCLTLKFLLHKYLCQLSSQHLCSFYQMDFTVNCSRVLNHFHRWTSCCKLLTNIKLLWTRVEQLASHLRICNLAATCEYNYVFDFQMNSSFHTWRPCLLTSCSLETFVLVEFGRPQWSFRKIEPYFEGLNTLQRQPAKNIKKKVKKEKKGKKEGKKKRGKKEKEAEWINWSHDKRKRSGTWLTEQPPILAKICNDA